MYLFACGVLDSHSAVGTMSKASRGNATGKTTSGGRAVPRAIGPMVVAAVATFASICTLAPDVGGPGMTCDELYYVSQGKHLVSALRQQGLAFYEFDNIRRNFPWAPDGPPVYPPLGDFILGCSHHVFDTAPDIPWAVTIVAARFAPALAFGLLVLLVGLVTMRIDGPGAGTIAAAAVMLVPRVFGHSHIAALDTLISLFCVGALAAVIEADSRGGRTRYFALAGVVWGLAMLTKLHGILLAPPVIIWIVWRMRRNSVLPLLAWGASGLATLYAGWPWLWLAPINNLRQFIATATDRQAIHVFYVGRVWEDVEVPWHYPLVMFVAALPVGLLILGVLGIWQYRRSAKPNPGYVLLLGSIAFLLAVFSWPGVPVYDGARLFLMVFPIWAVSVGLGAKWIVDHRALQRFSPAIRFGGVGLLVLLQGVGLFLYHPCQLSHYSLLVGGLRGAESLGFEATYWGDSVTEKVLAEASTRAAGGRLLFAPNLAQFQYPAVAGSSPSLAENEVELVGWDSNRPQAAAGCRYAVFYNRKANLAAIPEAMMWGKVVYEYRIQGVWLAKVVELPNQTAASYPDTVGTTCGRFPNLRSR